jgi:hypothetical protein
LAKVVGTFWGAPFGGWFAPFFAPFFGPFLGGTFLAFLAAPPHSPSAVCLTAKLLPMRDVFVAAQTT